MRHLRMTFRLRLALVYIAALVAVGAALLIVNYQIVANRLDRSVGNSSTIAISGTGEAKPGQVSVGAVPPTGAISGVVQPGVVQPGVGSPGSGTISWTTTVEQAVVQVRDTTLRELITYSIIAMGIVLILAAASGWLLAGRLLRPITVLTRATRRLTQGTLDQRIPVTGANDELRQLSTTFNDMLQRLQNAFAHEHRLMADVSHELRTPLANQRVVLEVALADPHPSTADLQAMGRTTLAQNIRAQLLIERMLVLARAEQAPTEDLLPLDLAELTIAARRRLAERLPESAHLDIRAHAHTATTHGDLVLIEQLIENLLTNAVLHNEPGGWITITTHTRPTAGISGSAAVLTVSNSGPPVDATLIGNLFEPFHRAVGARTESHRGNGLGLAICKAIATRHHGTITATGHPDGGLAITVNLPTNGP